MPCCAETDCGGQDVWCGSMQTVSKQCALYHLCGEQLIWCTLLMQPPTRLSGASAPADRPRTPRSCAVQVLQLCGLIYAVPHAWVGLFCFALMPCSMCRSCSNWGQFLLPLAEVTVLHTAAAPHGLSGIAAVVCRPVGHVDRLWA